MRISKFLGVVAMFSMAFASEGNSFPRSKQYLAPAGKETYVGDVPDGGDACFKVQGKDNLAPAVAHFRGLINGKPIDLDRHLGGRCLNFTRDGGVGLYRVYVIAEEGIDLIVTRTVNEGRVGGPWDGSPSKYRPAVH